ncbi:MAG TPA: hypothetical protein VE152_09915 [Acidimicrobiales bacterium]|nr:hypothetical protein [Acidimicrobiales bacterium]
MSQSLEHLDQEIDSFLGAHTDTAISASRVINPLLDLWQVASAMDPSVAAPVETLLTALVQRELTTPGELQEFMDQMRAAAIALETESGAESEAETEVGV